MPSKNNEKLTRLVLTYILITLIFSILIFIFSPENHSNEKISCDSNIYLDDQRNNIVAHGYYVFSLDGDNGWLKLKGEVTNENKSYTINRKLYFTSSRNCCVFILTVNSIVKSNDDNSPDSLLSKFLPLAYIKKGNKMDIFIYPQTDGGYLFTSSNLYSFYCENLKN